MEKHKLIILIGIPGCGKSTYAVRLAETTGARIVSSDGIRKELTGTEEYLHPELDGKVFGIFRSRVSEWIKETDVVADATNIRVKDWKTYVGLCPDGTEAIAYWFDICPDVAMARMEGRERKVPRDVVERMWATMGQNRQYLSECFPPERIVIVGPEEKA
jgi:predicted kinase